MYYLIFVFCDFKRHSWLGSDVFQQDLSLVHNEVGNEANEANSDGV